MGHPCLTPVIEANEKGAAPGMRRVLVDVERDNSARLMRCCG